MPRAETITRNGARERELSELAAQRPELSPWLRPLRVALASLDDDTWAGVAPVVSQHRAFDVAVLDEALVSIEPLRVRAHIRAVLAAALPAHELTAISDVEEIELLDRAINGQGDDGVSAGINTALNLAAVPLFVAAARGVAAPAQWTHGYCHVCGALPLFAEVLGLERTRQLRCGRCASAWKTNVLVCAFCGESDHTKLGSLVPGGPEGQICWVETCNSCHGYLKTRAALRGIHPEQVLIEDARTIDLDLVAAERGFIRPEKSGHEARIRLTTGGVN